MDDRGEAYELRPRAVVTVDRASGNVTHQWSLPPGMADVTRAGFVKVLVDGDRIALVTRYGYEMEGVIVFWRGSSPAVVLDRPMIVADSAVLRGDTLYFFNGFDHVTGAYDLAVLDPPLASLSPESAVAAARHEFVGEERLLCDRLQLLDSLGDFWLNVAKRTGDPLWLCALGELRVAPRPGASEVLRQLLAVNKNPDDLAPIAEALAHYDDPGSSAALVKLAKLPKPPDARSESIWSRGVAAAHDQLWRTGRASAYGLCPAQPSTRRVPALERRAADGSIGTAHPLLFEDVASDGRWCFICQARADTDGDGRIEVLLGRHGDVMGDDMLPYLVISSGPGWTFDEFIAADPRGRYVAVRKGACLEIVDTRGPSVVTLPDADLRAAGSAAFDALGQRLVYLRGGASNPIVIRDLGSGQQTEISGGDGLIIYPRFDPESRWVQVTAFPSGRAPTIATTLASGPCRGEATSFSVFRLSRAERQTVRLLPVQGDQIAHEGTDLIAPFGVDHLVRRDDGALAVRDKAGKESVVVPANCNGRLVHADPGRKSLVVACKSGHSGRARELWLFGPQGARALGIMDYRPTDSWTEPPTQIVEIDDRYVDVEAGRAVAAPPMSRFEVRKIVRNAHEAGEFASRGDGAVLRLDKPPERHSFPIGPLPLGPLRWGRSAE
jgi:hypothetical protein